MTNPSEEVAEHRAAAWRILLAVDDPIAFVELWLDTAPAVPNGLVRAAVADYRRVTGVRESDGLALYQKDHPLLHQPLRDAQSLLRRAVLQLGYDPGFVTQLGASKYDDGGEPAPWELQAPQPAVCGDNSGDFPHLAATDVAYDSREF